jgi:hypothetical protein
MPAALNRKKAHRTHTSTRACRAVITNRPAGASAVIDSAAHHEADLLTFQMATETARQGIVLLKNDGAMP